MNFAKSIQRTSVAFALCVAGSAAQAASVPVVTVAKDVCNATLMQFVDTPATVVYGPNGVYRVPLPIGVLDVGNCRHFYFEISKTSASSVDVSMGKISGPTLAGLVYSSPPSIQIQSLEVKGPEILVTLQGKPNTEETVAMWFYLTN